MRAPTFILRPGAFRLLLAGAVVLNHSTRIDLGFMAVFIFFVLSGFWITTMWRDRYSTLRQSYGVFIVSRIWRLWPVYLSVLALASIIWWALTGSAAIPLNALASNLFVLGLSRLPLAVVRLGQGWSLDVELQFYLVAPIVIWLMSKGKGLLRRATVLLVLATSIVAFQYLPWPLVNHSVLSFFGFFFVGVAGAIWDRPIPPVLMRATTLTGIALIAAILLHPDLRHMILGGRHPLPIFSHNWTLCGFLALLFSLYALETTKRESSRIDGEMGAISYIIYLVHMPILYVYIFYFGALPPIQRLAPLLVAWMVIGLISWVLLKVVDQPSERARKKFIARQMQRSLSKAGALDMAIAP